MESHSGQSVFGLILLSIVQWIVDHGETCCLATTELSLETKDEHYIRCGLVHFGKLLPDFSLGDCCLSRVQDIQNLWRKEGIAQVSLRHGMVLITGILFNLSYHLLPLKQTVCHELPSPECDTVVLKKKGIKWSCTSYSVIWLKKLKWTTNISTKMLILLTHWIINYITFIFLAFISLK